MPGRISLAFPHIHSSSSRTPVTDAGVGVASDMKKVRRLSSERSSFDFKRNSTIKGHTRTGSKSLQPVVLDVVIESPPLVFYGPTNTSTGALLSGQFAVVVVESDVQVKTCSLALLALLTTKKPVGAHCADCATKTNTLSRWDFLKEAHTFKKGSHSFPFSFLLPGHLPATSHGTLGVVEYKLVGKAVLANGEEIPYEHHLDVKRAISPGNEKSSTRIFPPTALTASVVLPPVIHPIGEFAVQFRMDGAVRRGKETSIRWRIRKLNWRIDEHSKMVSPACAKHSGKVGGEGKGVLHQDTRTLGGHEFKNGWKTDFDAGDGQIEMEFHASINPDTRPVCDVDSAAGLKVSHTLVIELIVLEESYTKGAKIATPTGSARVLRMTFDVLVTDRSGLGISWDEEQPPIYSDVPESPPHYTHMEDFDVESIDLDDHERTHHS